MTGLAIRHSSGLTPRIVQGSAYVANGDFERAIAEYTEANAFVYSFQGSAYLAKGDLDRAIVDYTEAIRLDPKWAGAFDNRGKAYATKGDRESSVGDFYDKAGCVMPALDILEIPRHINLPCSLPGSPTIETLRRAACRFVCWVNDIYSLRKELAEDGRMNTVFVIKQVYRCTLQEAIDRLRTMIDEQIHLFQETELDVIFQSPEVYQTIKHYLIELRGALRWYLDLISETNH